MKTSTSLTLAAAAALAGFSGAASAQSTVTIYGIVDQGVIKMNDAPTTANPGAGTRAQWNMKNGAFSRLGFRGTEDLGGGLYALFHLEHRFTADDGLPAVPFWNGRSVVGLRSDTLGELTLGRDYLPAFWPAVTADPWGWDTIGQMGRRMYTWANYSGGDAIGIRDNNMAVYKSPNLNGLTVSVSGALAEGVGTRGREIGGNAQYSAGPLYVGFGFDRTKNANPSAPSAELLLLSGAYQFSIVRPSAVFARSKSFTGVTTKSLGVGARVTLGLGELRVGAAHSDPDGPNNNATKWSLGYFYFLSKRSALYTDVGSAKQDGVARSTGIDVGIRHFF